MTECELLLFHSTTRENLKGIMEEGIKPGMKGGWCDLWIKMLEKDYSLKTLSKEELEREKKEIDDYKKECNEVIFLSPSFHDLEEEMPPGSEIIIILCLPKKIVYIPSKKLKRYVPFEEWEELQFESEEKYNQVIAKEIILPHYIIGYLDVVETRYGEPFGTKFKIGID